MRVICKPSHIASMNSRKFLLIDRLSRQSMGQSLVSHGDSGWDTAFPINGTPVVVTIANSGQVGSEYNTPITLVTGTTVSVGNGIYLNFQWREYAGQILPDGNYQMDPRFRGFNGPTNFNFGNLTIDNTDPLLLATTRWINPASLHKAYALTVTFLQTICISMRDHCFTAG